MNLDIQESLLYVCVYLNTCESIGTGMQYDNMLQHYDMQVT